MPSANHHVSEWQQPPASVGPFCRKGLGGEPSDQKRMKNQQPVAVERTSAPNVVRLTAKVQPGRLDLL